MGGSQLNDINWVRGLSAGFQQHSPPAPDEVYSKPLAGASTHDLRNRRNHKKKIFMPFRETTKKTLPGPNPAVAKPHSGSFLFNKGLKGRVPLVMEWFQNRFEEGPKLPSGF